jgi:hypothetical protein
MISLLERDRVRFTLDHSFHAKMKKDYWDVTDEQVIEKTGNTLGHWMKILAAFDAAAKPSGDVAAYLQTKHGVPRYWARTLTTRYAKSQS